MNAIEYLERLDRCVDRNWPDAAGTGHRAGAAGRLATFRSSATCRPTSWPWSRTWASNGLVGLIALGIILWLFSNRIDGLTPTSRATAADAGCAAAIGGELNAPHYWHAIWVSACIRSAHSAPSEVSHDGIPRQGQALSVGVRRARLPHVLAIMLIYLILGENSGVFVHVGRRQCDEIRQRGADAEPDRPGVILALIYLIMKRVALSAVQSSAPATSARRRRQDGIDRSGAYRARMPPQTGDGAGMRQAGALSFTARPCP